MYYMKFVCESCMFSDLKWEFIYVKFCRRGVSGERSEEKRFPQDILENSLNTTIPEWELLMEAVNKGRLAIFWFNYGKNYSVFCPCLFSLCCRFLSFCFCLGKACAAKKPTVRCSLYAGMSQGKSWTHTTPGFLPKVLLIHSFVFWATLELAFFVF